ncbi:radical SAM/SPASM domain-containing protein [Streptosporangium roseum]|uniref:radical SAM/SPASM domain-containing protein n=1 Tax=Streptosporangium roseum TaxID=2001 RepID=UPI00341F66D3
MRPPSARVRYNAEDFGFIVGFPDGEILLAEPSAALVLRPEVTRAELEPHLLRSWSVPAEFHLRTPALMWLELTRGCDFACPHCYIGGGPRRPAELPPSRWYELLEEMASMGVWGVAFTGGEPTLHPDFADLVRHARRLDLLVGVATHGMNLTEELLAGLPRDGVIISVSIDDLHVRRPGVRAIETSPRDAILLSKKMGFLTNVMTNTHKGNIGRLGELMDWAEANGVSVRSVPFSPIGRGKSRPELENTVEDVEAAAEFWVRECAWEHEYHQSAGLCVGAIFNYGLTLSYMTRRCSSARFLGYVAADGTLYPCTMCASEELFPAGSVRERPFAEVWRGDWEIRRYSWDNFETTCEGCPINSDEYYCSARCPAMSHARHGTLFDCGASSFEIASTVRRTSLLHERLPLLTASTGPGPSERSPRP